MLLMEIVDTTTPAGMLIFHTELLSPPTAASTTTSSSVATPDRQPTPFGPRSRPPHLARDGRRRARRLRT